MLQISRARSKWGADHRHPASSSGGHPHRGAVQIIEHFGRPFFIADWPAGVNATQGRPSLASQAAKYLPDLERPAQAIQGS